MNSLTLQKRQALNETQKFKRLERSKILLNELSHGTAGEVVWSDEKIFTVKRSIIAETVTKIFRDICNSVNESLKTVISNEGGDIE